MEQLHVLPLPCRGTSRLRGPARSWLSAPAGAGGASAAPRAGTGFTYGIKSNDRSLPLNHTQPGWTWKVRTRESTNILFFPAGIMRGAVPSPTDQNPEPFLRHPCPHAFPASSGAMVFLGTAGKGERRRCPACTSLPANGNSGSGPRSGFPHLVQPSEKLAMVLLPLGAGLGAGMGAQGRARGYPAAAASGSGPQRIAAGYRGEPAASAPGGRWRHSSHHFPISEQIYEPPQSSPAALQEGWGWGLAGGCCLQGIVNLLSYTAAYHCATVIP